MARALEPYLADDVAVRLVAPKAEPVEGAIMMARRADGLAGLPS
jgi:hypothetical protein